MGEKKDTNGWENASALFKMGWRKGNVRCACVEVMDGLTWRDLSRINTTTIQL